MPGGIPLTEERFIELFKSMFETMFETISERKFSEMENRLESKLESSLDRKLEQKLNTALSPIIDKINKMDRLLGEVYSFQQYESKAIESELGQVLKNDLNKKYPQNVVSVFPMRKLYDPKSGHLITDLDAAYLVKPLLQSPDYSRLITAGLPIPTIKPMGVSTSARFVLAEAKHHINRKKISEKLNQLEHIIKMFEEAKIVAQSTDDVETLSKIYKVDFIHTVRKNKYFSEINEYELYFGGLYWEPSLIATLEADVETFNNLCKEFRTSTKKVEIYKKIVALENKWYTSNRVVLSDDDIQKLFEMNGIFGNITVIYPSGERYTITDPENHTPSGVSTLPLKGGMTKINKTKKHKSSPVSKQ